MNKNQWLDWAELVDSYRVFPRLFLVACFVWSVNTSYILIDWYIKLPDASRGLEASGFGTLTLTAILTFMKLVYTTYSDAGRSWGPPTPSTTTSSTVVASKTEVTQP